MRINKQEARMENALIRAMFRKMRLNPICKGVAAPLILVLSVFIASAAPYSSIPSDSQRNSQGRMPNHQLIYVLDPNRMGAESQVLLVDTEDGRIVRTYKAGYNPDMALSPDGKRLYLASTVTKQNGEAPAHILQIIDTESGEMIRTIDNPDRAQPTHWEYRSRMAVSPDGNWLYIFKHRDSREGDFYYIDTLDTRRGRFLSEKPYLPLCFNALLFPLAKPLTLDIMCTGSKDISFIKLQKHGQPTIKSMRALEPQSRVGIQTVQGIQDAMGKYLGPGFLSADKRSFTTIFGDSRFFSIDSESLRIIKSDVIDRESRGRIDAMTKTAKATADDWLADSWLQIQPALISPDGQRVYFGIGRLAHFQQSVWSFDRIAVLDSRTLTRVAVIKPSQMFWSLALNKDGSRLYAISPEQASIIVIDPATGREIRTLYGIGESPIFGVAAP